MSQSHVPQSRAITTLLPQLLLASMNINGLTPETEWGVTNLLEERHFDVSSDLIVYSFNPFYQFRFLPSVRPTVVQKLLPPMFPPQAIPK